MRQTTDVQKSKANSILPVLSLILGLTCVVMGAVFVISRFINDKKYEEKWKEYDECGLI